MKKQSDDLELLGERIKDLRKQEANVRKDKPESRFSYASKVGFRVGTELLSGVVLGAALGYFLDDFFGTKPLLLIVLLFLGGAAGILNVYRFAKSEEKDERNKE